MTPFYPTQKSTEAAEEAVSRFIGDAPRMWTILDEQFNSNSRSKTLKKTLTAACVCQGMIDSPARSMRLYTRADSLT